MTTTMLWTLRIAAAYGIVACLALIRRGLQPWVRICVQGEQYRVVVSRRAINGRNLCLLVLLYFPRLRAFLEGAGPVKAARKLAFDELVLQAIERLRSDCSAATLYRWPELPSLLQRAELSGNSTLPHSYHIELFRTVLGRGVAPLLPEGSPSASLLLHYIELLRVVANGVAPETRLNLLTSLQETVCYTRSFPHPDSDKAIGLTFYFANRVFLVRWYEAALQKWREGIVPGTDFQTTEVRVARSSAPFRRMGFYAQFWVKLLAVAAYPFAYYCVGGRTPDVLSLAFALNAGLWILAGALIAQGIGWFRGEPYASSVMVGNALWQHGATFRGASTALLALALLSAVSGARWQYAHACALVAAVFVGSSGCEMLGYSLFARVIAKSWRAQLGRDTQVDSKHPPRARLSYLPLYMTLSNFSVFIPYAIALLLMAAVLKLANASLFVIIVSTAVVATVARAGVPLLFRWYAQRRVPKFNAILLRKFFNARHSNMLRNVVSPAIGVYGTVLTLSDPSYEAGRERMIGMQEIADSVKDAFAQVRDTLKSTDTDWKVAVRNALAGADLVVIDVTQTTEYLSWEIAEALTLRDPECVLLVCSLEGYTGEKLGLAKTVLQGLEEEVSLRGKGGRQLVQRFQQILPPLVYATFPCSFVFRVRLVRRLRVFLGARRSLESRAAS